MQVGVCLEAGRADVCDQTCLRALQIEFPLQKLFGKRRARAHWLNNVSRSRLSGTHFKVCLSG